MKPRISRPKVWKALQRAWKNTIEEDYNTSKVLGSEHHLQAAFYSRLKQEIWAIHPDWKIFVEPKIRLPDTAKSTVFPDIIICNTNTLICVIELKYAPRVRISQVKGHQKDIQTLSTLARWGKEICLVHDRYLGIEKSKIKPYEQAANVLYVWAGVYKAGDDPGLAKIFDPTQVKFKSLHALTHEGKPAEVHPNIDIKLDKVCSCCGHPVE